MEYDFSHIEEYLEGRLSVEDHSDFEESLQSNVNLQRDLELYKEMHQFVKSEAAIDRSIQGLKEVHNEMTEQRSKSSQKNSKWRTLTILLALLLLSSLVFYFSSGDSEPEKPEIIYAALFDPQPMSMTSRGVDGSIALEQITEMFNNKNYKEALLTIESLDGIDELPRIRYMSAISYLAENELSLCRKTFLQLINDYSIYTDDAHWYLGLSYLKEAEVEKAIEFFELLPPSYIDSKDADNQIQKLMNSIN